MAGLGLVGFALTVGSFISFFPAVIVDSYHSLREEYDSGPRLLLLLFIFPDARETIHRIQRRILRSTGEEAMAMKKSLTDDCTMLAVAAAIVAQIAITALSLNGLTTVHWTAQAGFIISLVTAALSVFYACLVQQRLSSLFSPDDLKDWLSIPFKDDILFPLNTSIEENAEIRLFAESSLKNARKVTRYLDAVKKNLEFGRCGKASLNAALMVKSPALLLKVSVASFLIGLGVYLGCVWTYDVDAPRPRSQSLNILIIYIVVTALGFLLYFVPRSLKYFETTSADKWKHPFNYVLTKFANQFNNDKEPPDHRIEDQSKQTSRDTSEKVVEWHMKEFEKENEEFANFRRRHAGGVDERINTNDVEAGPQFLSPGRLDAGRDFLSPEPAQTTGIQPQSFVAQNVHSTAQPLVVALEASIKAQEQSTAALRKVLEAQQKILTAQENDSSK